MKYLIFLLPLFLFACSNKKEKILSKQEFVNSLPKPPEKQPISQAKSLVSYPVGGGFDMSIDKNGDTVSVILTANRNIPNEATRIDTSNTSKVLTCAFFLRLPHTESDDYSYSDSTFHAVAEESVKFIQGVFPGMRIVPLYFDDHISLFSGKSLESFGFTDDGYDYIPFKGVTNYKKVFYKSGSSYTIAKLIVPNNWGPIEIVRSSVTLKSMSCSDVPFLSIPEKIGFLLFPFNQIR